MQLVDQELIDRLKHDEMVSEANMLAANGTTYCGQQSVEADERQELWLHTFERAMSVSYACRKTGVPLSTYGRWRTKDWRFCERLNEIIARMRDELATSAYVRAIGHTVVNPETGEVVTDAEGRVMRQGGSDSLTRALLGLDKPVVQIGQLQTVVFEMMGADDEDGPALEHTTVEELVDDSLARAVSYNHPTDGE